MKKTMLILSVIILLSFSTLVYAGSFFSVWEMFQKKQNSNYCDMKNSWASAQAEYLFENDLIKGECLNGNHYFYPEKNITRGEFITYISEVLMLPDTEKIPDFKDKNDTPEVQLTHAARAYSKGIINGSGEADGLYLYPSDNLTRIEAFHIINNILKKDSFPTPKMNFSDAYTMSENDLDVISHLVSKGFIKGYSDNTIRPYTKLTREQAISLIYTLITNSELKNF